MTLAYKDENGKSKSVGAVSDDDAGVKDNRKTYSSSLFSICFVKQFNGLVRSRPCKVYHDAQ